MGQLQKVSWRTAGYAALGTVVAVASVVAVINSDGVRPTALASSGASRWLVDQVNKRVVLVDGLAGKVVAKIATESEGTDEVAVQGAGGAFLVGQTAGSIRSISSSKLQLGPAQAVGVLLENDATFRVGTSGLTVVSPATSKASIVAVDDVTRLDHGAAEGQGGIRSRPTAACGCSRRPRRRTSTSTSRHPPTRCAAARPTGSPPSGRGPSRTTAPTAPSVGSTAAMCWSIPSPTPARPCCRSPATTHHASGSVPATR